MYQRIVSFIAAFTLFLLGIASAHAFITDSFSRGSLRGIETITVTVDPPPQYIYDDLRVRGITAEKVQEEISERLRAAGFNVVGYTEALEIPEAALLSLRIRLVRSSKGVYSYGLYLSANRKVLIGDDTSFESVRVWSDFKVGGTSISFLREIEGYVYELVDRFILEHQAQN